MRGASQDPEWAPRPDGTRKECRQGLLVWHDRDAQGNLIPNDVVEYRLGTLSLLPGVEPDPDHPGQVRPVWGVAEVLESYGRYEARYGLDVSSKPRLRMKLVNVNVVVQTAAGFKVHFCPRFDHEANPSGPGWACPTEPPIALRGTLGVSVAR